MQPVKEKEKPIIINKSIYWWIPLKKVGSYSLGSRIKDFREINNNHYLELEYNKDREDNDLYYTHNSNDITIAVYNNILCAATYWKEFYIHKNTNIIGEHLDYLISQLKQRFDPDLVKCQMDICFEHDDGDIITDYEFEALGLTVSCKESGEIHRISASNFENLE